MNEKTNSEGDPRELIPMDGQVDAVDGPVDAVDGPVDTVDGLPAVLRFNLFDASWIVFSICMYLFDVGSDVWLAHGYYAHGDIVFFALTVGIVLFTSIVLTVLSAVW